jgi:hypothetical protein
MRIKRSAAVAGLAVAMGIGTVVAHASAKPTAAAPAAAAAAKVTLGSARFASEVPQFQGAGKVKPKVFGDGNTCEGQASELRWKNWGSSRATATGKICDTSVQLVAAEAVAYDLGRCTPGGPKVYRRAKVREHGGSWGSLNTFGANGRLCKKGS